MDKDTTKTTLTEYLFPLNVEAILREIEQLRLDKYTKKLDTMAFTKLFAFAQIKQIDSLTDVSLTLNENEKLQKLLALESISTSQLSRKLRDLPPEVFMHMFRQCVVQIERQYGKKRTIETLGPIHLIDSSTISMCLSQYRWAEFRQTKAGVKAHVRVVFFDGRIYPDKAVLTPARPADRTQMDELVVTEPDALNVFDRGYVDYRKFDSYCEDGIRFVTRLKSNAAIHEILKERTIGTDFPLRDRDVRLGRSPSYVMRHALRLVETIDSEGNKVIVLTNDFSMDAEEISDLYRIRWQIELFFRWIKQHLVVKRLYGKSQSAVYNQLLIAMITYCLLVLMQLKIAHRGRLLDIFKQFRLHWSDPFSAFIKAMFRKPDRSSRGRRRWPEERIFEETLQQAIDGETAHWNSLTYDPLIL